MDGEDHQSQQLTQITQIAEVDGELQRQYLLEQLRVVAGALLIMLLQPLQVDGVQQQKLLLPLVVGANQIKMLTIQEVDGANQIIQEDSKMEIVKEEEAEVEEVIEAIEVVEAEVIFMIEEKDLLLRGINQIQSP